MRVLTRDREAWFAWTEKERTKEEEKEEEE